MGQIYTEEQLKGARPQRSLSRAQGSSNTDGLLKNSQNFPVSHHTEVAAPKIFLK